MKSKRFEYLGEWVDSQTKWLFQLPLFIALGIILFYPCAYAISLSFSKWFMVINPSPTWFTFDNYVKLFRDARFLAAIRRTFFFTFVAVGIQLIFGLGVALLLNCEIKGKKVYRILFLLPMMATPMVVAFSWRMMFDYSFGVINYFIHNIGFPRIEFLGNPNVVMWSIIIVDIWQWTAFMAMIILAGLYSLPRDPVEAARMDGANRWQRFFYIILPLIKSHLGAAIMLRSIAAFKTFELIWGMTEAGPNFSSETLYPFTYAQSFRYYYMGYASAAGLIFFLLILGINLTLNYIRRPM